MTFPKSPHIALGEGTQVGIITLWTKKEHVLRKLRSDLYVVASQLYSRDEGISELLRSLLKRPDITDLLIVGADLNMCADTLFALWENGVINGQVQGAPGYVDTEIPTEVIDDVRKNVILHDLRKEKNYEVLNEYIERIPKRVAYAKPREYPKPRITPPHVFPSAMQFPIRASSIDQATIELAHLGARFGKLANVQVHLLEKGKLPGELAEQEKDYVHNMLSSEEGTYGYQLHANNRLHTLVSEMTKEDVSVIVLTDNVHTQPLDLIQLTRMQDGIHLQAHMRKTTLSEFPLLCAGLFELLQMLGAELDEPAVSTTVVIGLFDPSPSHLLETFLAKAHVLRRQGDPKSNILIRLREGRIQITHLSPQGKRLEEFEVDSAQEGYKRLVVEHRITDLSHAAYLGYELAKAQRALMDKSMYEQDS